MLNRAMANDQPVVALRAWSQAAALQAVGAGHVGDGTKACRLADEAKVKIQAAHNAGELTRDQMDYAFTSVDVLQQLLFLRWINSMIDMVDDVREMAKTGVQESIARIKDLRARYAAVFNPTLPEEFDVWRFQEVDQPQLEEPAGEQQRRHARYHYPGRLYDDGLLYFALDSLAGALTRDKSYDVDAAMAVEDVACEMIELFPDNSRGFYWAYKAASLADLDLEERAERMGAGIDRLTDDQLEKGALFGYIMMSIMIQHPDIPTSTFRDGFRRVRETEKNVLLPLGLDVPRAFEAVIVVRAAIKALKPGEDDKLVKLKLEHDGFDPRVGPALVCAFCHKHSLRLSTCSRCRSIKYCSTECQKKDWPQHKRVCKLQEAVGSQ